MHRGNENTSLGFWVWNTYHDLWPCLNDSYLALSSCHLNYPMCALLVPSSGWLAGKWECIGFWFPCLHCTQPVRVWLFFLSHLSKRSSSRNCVISALRMNWVFSSLCSEAFINSTSNDTFSQILSNNFKND